MNSRIALALAVGASLLGGCSSTGPKPAPEPAVSGDAAAGDSALRTGSAVDEIACEFAVAKATNNGDTEVLGSESSEANTLVIIGVGEQKAKWKCLVKDGKVAEVMSLADEGRL